MTNPALTDDTSEPDSSVDAAGAPSGIADSNEGPVRGLPRWVPLAVGFLAVVAFLGFLSGTSNDDVTEPTAFDEFALQTMDGDTVTLADFDGPLVVNYFAAWCAPCRAELPDFEEVSQETAGDVVFVGISRDHVTDSWRSLIDETGVTFPTLYEGSVQGSFEYIEGISMPTTVFVSADGDIERIWSGPLTDDKLRELIAEHLT